MDCVYLFGGVRSCESGHRQTKYTLHVEIAEFLAMVPLLPTGFDQRSYHALSPSHSIHVSRHSLRRVVCVLE